jgi:uncharacterized membrane protein
VLDRLLRGFPGHPLHPPLTDATIGMYTLATALAVSSSLGWIERPAAHGAWLAMIGGLVVTVPTALTGFLDWVTIEWGSPRWRTATLHLSAMLVATTLFALAAWQDRSGYDHAEVTTAGVALAVAGFVALTAGGWLGGSVVFVHGMRVLGNDDSTGRRRQSGSDPIKEETE